MDNITNAKRKNIPTFVLIVFFALIVLVSSAFLIFSGLKDKKENQTAKIYSQGNLIKTIELEKVEKSYTIEINGCVVLVEKGQISIQSADCPDKLCVNRGKISSGFSPIVCLPNRVMITVENSQSVTDAFIG